jgi:hypothetical protein
LCDFLSYFALTLKRRKESLVWGLQIFGGEVDVSGFYRQNTDTLFF